jgi:maltooligosyltrehalose trehalohydrolase
MGEEYGERAPFYYFVSHGDPALVEAVREGRREEFRTFGWEREPQDPQAEATFLASKLNHRLRGEGCHRLLVAFYTALLRLRRHNPALANLRKEDLRVKVIEGAKALVVERWKGDERATLVANLGRTPSPVVLPPTRGRWVKELDSTEEAWGGPGSSLPGHWPGGDGGPLELPPLSCAVHLEERGV